MALSDGISIVKRFFQKDCHFPSGFVLETSGVFSVAFSSGISLL